MADEMDMIGAASQTEPGGDDMIGSTSTLPPSLTPTQSVLIESSTGDFAHDITFLSDVSVTATVEIGHTVLPIREVLKLRRGSVVELEKLVGQPADLLINNTPLARGEVIVINERFGFRITKFITPTA